MVFGRLFPIVLVLFEVPAPKNTPWKFKKNRFWTKDKESSPKQKKILSVSLLDRKAATPW